MAILCRQRLSFAIVRPYTSPEAFRRDLPDWRAVGRRKREENQLENKASKMREFREPLPPRNSQHEGNIGRLYMFLSRQTHTIYYSVSVITYSADTDTRFILV